MLALILHFVNNYPVDDVVFSALYYIQIDVKEGTYVFGMDGEISASHFSIGQTFKYQCENAVFSLRNM